MNRFAPGFRVLVVLLCAFSSPRAHGETTWYGYRGEPEYRNLFFRDPLPRSELLPININNHWGLSDQFGYVIALPEFEWTDYGYDGLSRAMLGGKTGFIRGDGDWYIDPVFDWVDRFEDNHAVFRRRGRYGMIDQRGRVAIEPRFEGLLRFRESVAAAMLDGKVGFLDKTGDWSIPPRFAVARSFHDSLAAVQFFDEDGQGGAWGYINRRGDTVWRDESGTVTELGDFNEGAAAFRVEGPDGASQWGYFDRRFAVTIEPRFSRARDFTNGVASVEVLGEGWGFLNRAGDWEVTPQFDDADDFDTRLAMIRHQGLYGYIDRQGRTGIYPQFRDAEPFQFGVARVAREDSFAYIGPTAFVFWDPLLREPGGLLHRGLVDKNTVGRGLIDKTVGGHIRRRVRTTGTDIGHDRQLYPRYRGQVPIPYEPEYQYEERLPPRTAAGLLIPRPENDTNNKPEGDDPNVEVVEDTPPAINLGEE